MTNALPEWWFPPQLPNTRANENSNAEHFRTLNTEGKAQAFVRESFQNSIDGAISPGSTVRLRIFLSGAKKALPAVTAGNYMNGLFEHLEACSAEIKIDVVKMKKSPCQFLVFEDFGTTGLTGDEAAWDMASPAIENNHFFHFFRTVGRSGKSGENLGRWGIGKFVFLMASEARALFGYTIREGEAGATSRLLMGSTTLRYHVIGEKSFVNEGWFARRDTPDSPAMPVAEGEVLDRFVADWNLARTTETGLSIVVPFVEQIDGEDLLFAIVNEYCGKILEGRLEVQLEIADDDAVINVSQETIREIIARHDGDAKWDAIGRTVQALTWYLEEGRHTPIHLMAATQPIKKPIWGEIELEEAVVEEIRSRLEDEHRVVVHVPVSVTKKNPNKTAESFFEVVLIRQPPGLQRPAPPIFFRRWLRISGRQMASPINGMDTFLIVGDGMLGSLLGDAEGPAHTEWSDSRDKFKDTYQYGPQWLTFVKGAPRKVFERVLGAITERNYQAFEDLFPRPMPTGSKKRVESQPKQQPGKGGETGKPNPPEPGPPPGLQIMFSDDGFRVRCDGSAPVSTVTVEIAFDVRTGDPFKKWHPADFDVEKLKVAVEVGSGKVISRADNKVVAQVQNLADFELQISGFDANRDLCVRATPAIEVPE